MQRFGHFASLSDYFKALVIVPHTAKHTKFLQRNGGGKQQTILPPVNLCKKSKTATSQTQNVKLVKIVFLGIIFDHLLNMGI